MSRSLAVFLAILSVSSTASVAQEASALDRESRGWVDLLASAGAGLKGFTRLPIPPEGKLSDVSPWSFNAQAGILECRGDLGGHEWLRWDEKLEDGTLHVEWRFVPVDSGKGYNSGVFCRNSADGKVWHQAQTGDASGGFLFGDTPVGGELKRVKKPGGGEKPAGQWNVFELKSEGSTLSLWVNGETTSTWEDLEAPAGYAGLEAEGFHIEFKKVLFRPVETKP